MRHDIMMKVAIVGMITCAWLLYLINGGGI
jgi:hypothetical protein